MPYLSFIRSRLLSSYPGPYIPVTVRLRHNVGLIYYAYLDLPLTRQLSAQLVSCGFSSRTLSYQPHRPLGPAYNPLTYPQRSQMYLVPPQEQIRNRGLLEGCGLVEVSLSNVN